MPTLILNFPEGETTAFAVDGDIVTLGRARHNHLCLAERHVSSVHAEFRRRPDGAYEVIDLGSLNGTYVNGVRITERYGLHEGDRIVFGVIEGKFFNARPNADDHQLTRGLEIDFLKAAEVIRANPEVAQAAAELQRKIEGANGKHLAPAPGPSPIPLARPAPVPGQAPAPAVTPVPMRNPTIQLVTPSRPGRHRQVVLEVQEPGPIAPVAPAAGTAPDAFLPGPRPAAPPAAGSPGSPFSVAPPENGGTNGNGRMPPPMPNGQVPPARRTPWQTLLGKRKQGDDEP